MTNDAYKDAGVDIEAGNTLVERIKPFIKQTHRTGVMGGFGGFGSFFDPKAAGYKDPIFVSGTDGVGTKLKIAIETGIYDTIGIDLVAMCVNDLLVQGAEPLFFLDYFATSHLDVDIGADIIKGIADGCKQSGCALIGGETAEMPGLYAKDDFDLAGFAVGAVEREDVVTGEKIEPGDIILGLTSSGVHSNGFSLVRKILNDNSLSFKDASPFDASKTLGQCFIEPTRLYVKSVLNVLKNVPVNGMSHITGGGLSENIPRVIPDDLMANINLDSWQLPPIFEWMQGKANLDDTNMLRTFNCGIGFVLIVNPDDVDTATALLEQNGEKVIVLGSILKSSDKSKISFSGKLG